MSNFGEGQYIDHSPEDAQIVQIQYDVKMTPLRIAGNLYVLVADIYSSTDSIALFCGKLLKTNLC